MTFRLIVLVLPELILATIELRYSLQFKGNTSNMETLFEGEEVSIISNVERKSFNLTDSNLKKAVETWFGKSPHKAYLSSPTMPYDLYKSYNWHQVNRTLRPINCKILKVYTNRVFITEVFFKNIRRKPTTFDIGVNKKIRNKVKSVWTTEGELSVPRDIQYIIKVEVDKLDRDINFYYTSPWGKNAVQVRDVFAGPSSHMDMVLEPGKGVVSRLYATKGIIQLQMEYEAIIFGQTAVTYKELYKGHHFWGLDVADCMNSAGLSNRQVAQEVLDIVFYFNSSIIVVNETNGDKIKEAVFNVTYL